MKKHILLAVVVATLVLLIGATTASADDGAHEQALAAQGLAWRLRQEAAELGLHVPAAERKYQEAEGLFAEGKYFNSRWAHQAASALWIDAAVNESLTCWRGDRALYVEGVFSPLVVHERWHLGWVMASLRTHCEGGWSVMTEGLKPWWPHKYAVYLALDGDRATAWEDRSSKASDYPPKVVFSARWWKGQRAMRGVRLFWAEKPNKHYLVRNSSDEVAIFPPETGREVSVLFFLESDWFEIHFASDDSFELAEIDFFDQPRNP